MSQTTNQTAVQTTKQSNQGQIEKILEKCLLSQVVLNDNKARLTERVAHRALAIARVLNLPFESRVQLELAALLHRVGEASLPTHLQDKCFLDMNAAELDEYRQYPLMSALHVRTSSRNLLNILMHHREYMDNSGFLVSGRSSSIPVEARILCVASEFEEMMLYHGDCPAKRMEIERRFAANLTSRYDPRIVAALLLSLSREAVKH